MISCWRCANGVRGCCERCDAGAPTCGSRGIGFPSVQAFSGRKLGGKARAPTFEQNMVLVRGGPLAQRVEPAKRALSGGLSAGVSGWSQNMTDMAKGYHGPTLQAIALSGFGFATVAPLAAFFVGGDRARQAQGQAYAGWQSSNRDRVVVVNAISQAQVQLDALDRDRLALEKTLKAVDASGSGPTVEGAVSVAKQQQESASGLIDELQATEDALNAKAANFAKGGGSPADLSASLGLVKTLQGQTATAHRALMFAVAYARNAVRSVNAWIDDQNTRAAYAAQQAEMAAATRQVTDMLLTAPYTPMQTGLQ